MVRFAAAALMSVIVSGPATAQDNVPWKRVGNWDIAVDRTLGNGCYATASWTGGTALRLGLNPALDNYYILLGNERWASLVADREYDVQIRFGNNAPWDITMRGLQFAPGGQVYLHVQSQESEFVDEFMWQSAMVIVYKGREIESLALTGSRRAFQEVRACQKVVDAKGISAPDPFAEPENPDAGQQKKGDPFAD